MSVGQIILSQLQCSRNSLWCWGARSFKTFNETFFTNVAHCGGLLFTVSGLKFKGQVMVRLMGSDLYLVSIGKLQKGVWTERASVSDVFCEDLEGTIDGMVEGTLDKSSAETKKMYQDAKVPFFG